LTRKYIYFSVFALFAVVLHGLYFFGPNILYLLCITFVISTIAELVSLKTPLYCFGVRYRYDVHHKIFSSHVNLLGVYPIEIAFTWMIFKYISFVMAMMITSVISLPIILEVILIPLILVSLDFIIDPIAVKKTRLWHWERGSCYFGIPVQNFIGWYLVGLVSTVIFMGFGVWKPLTFNVLLFLPILFYGSFLRHVSVLFTMDKQKAICGVLPVALWTALAAVSLCVLFLQLN